VNRPPALNRFDHRPRLRGGALAVHAERVERVADNQVDLVVAAVGVQPLEELGQVEPRVPPILGVDGDLALELVREGCELALQLAAERLLRPLVLDQQDVERPLDRQPEVVLARRQVQDQVDDEGGLPLAPLGDQLSEPQRRQDAVILGAEQGFGGVTLGRDELVERHREGGGRRPLCTWDPVRAPVLRGLEARQCDPPRLVDPVGDRPAVLGHRIEDLLGVGLERGRVEAHHGAPRG
jgi:hypothetical protein